VDLSKVATYRDDPMGTGHLKLEVSVIRNGHELGITWSPQDGVVGAGEVRYLKGVHFHVEVCSTFERYGQVNLPEGNGLKFGYDSVEQSTGWSYHRSRQSHGVVGLGVEEVETTPAIHEDTRQEGLAMIGSMTRGKCPVCGM
jgi:hypothetical protein